MSCVRIRRQSCWTSSRISRRIFSSSVSPRSPAVHPTSSPRCTLSLSGFIFEKQSLCFWYCCWYFLGGFLGNTERWWGCRLRRCWRWYRRSRKFWGKFTRRRSTCLSICIPRRRGPFGKGFHAPGIYRYLCFDIILSLIHVFFYAL
jgi:hypothetical protein